MYDPADLKILDNAMQKLAAGFESLPETQQADFDRAAVEHVLGQVAERMHDNYPYPHPLYAGQMLKPPHTVARLAYAMSLWINPNNHALDGGRASSAMEKDAVRHIAAMYDWDEYLGHLTSGGTMANLEALWVADSLHPGERVLSSEQAHYTHSRLCGVLKIPHDTVRSNARAEMDLDALESELKRGDVGTVVVTMGTTGFGAVDPLDEIIALQAHYDFRIHADAAYGGYFVLADSLDEHIRTRFDALSKVDSIVIDPHKHGLQPYGCGCVLFRDPSVGRLYQHDSAYTYFTSDELHLGEISLECSRAGSSAVALWATQQLLPSVRGEAFAASLDDCLHAARDLHTRLDASDDYRSLMNPSLDIVVYSAEGDDQALVSRRNESVFDRAANGDLHLALMTVGDELTGLASNGAGTSCLRSVLMKPEHRAWVPEIEKRLVDALKSDQRAS